MPSTVEKCDEGPDVKDVKAKAAKRKAKSPKKGKDKVVVENGAPLTRCVGKRKVEQCKQQTRNEESIPETKVEDPPCEPPVRSTGKKGKGVKAKKRQAPSQGTKDVGPVPPTDEPRVTQVADTANSTTVAPCEVKIKKLMIKSKAKLKAKTKGGDTNGGEGAKAEETEDSPESKSKVKGKEAKGKPSKAQIPIRRLLLPNGDKDLPEERKIINLDQDERPKWKKRLLLIGKKRIHPGPVEVLEEPEVKVETKTWTLEACFAGKRKMPSPEIPEVPQVPKKGLLRLGFQPISKVEEKEAQDLPPNPETADQAEAHEVADAEAMVVDLEAKRPRFNWKESFAKLSVAPEAPQAQVPEAEKCATREEVLEIPDSSPRGASKLNKQGSKKGDKLICSKAPVDWCERHVPSQQKQLKPQKAWQEFREWLRTWRPNRKGKEAAIVTGSCGSGKTAGVRFIVRKLRGQFMEYDLADLQGRSFLENLAKKQRNGNQLSEDAMAQVLICNISENITAAQKECLALAVQASPGPLIFTTAEGIFGPKDAIYKMCLEFRICLSETLVAKQIHDISKKEALELPLELCRTVATACPGDLRKGLQVAQLLSVLSGSGQACLPQAACAPLTACDRLLRGAVEKVSLEDALCLLELEEDVPMLLRFNLLPALSYAWTQRRSSEEMKLLMASMDSMEVVEAAKEEKLETEQEEEHPDEGATGDVEMAKEVEDTEDLQQSNEKEETEVALEQEMEDLADDDDLPEKEDCKDESQVIDVEEVMMPKPATEEELQDLETCARIASSLATSDMVGGLAVQAAEQAGPTIDLCTMAEPLLLAILSREVQHFGASSETCRKQRKHFQSTKALPDPVCPISMDQVAMLALQLNVPKAWVIDRIYDWILGSRSNHASNRHLKNFRTWLKRQVQLWQQRQGRVGQELTSRGPDPVGVSDPLPAAPTVEEMSKALTEEMEDAEVS